MFGYSVTGLDLFEYNEDEAPLLFHLFWTLC